MMARKMNKKQLKEIENYYNRYRGYERNEIIQVEELIDGVRQLLSESAEKDKELRQKCYASGGCVPLTERDDKIKKLEERIGWDERLRELLPESLKPFPLDCAVKNHIENLRKDIAEKDKEIARLKKISIEYRAIDLCTYEGDKWYEHTDAGKELWRKQARAEIEKELKEK
jgi:hypothetical protein